MNEPWRILLFGGLSARQGDKTITRFKSQKIATLLAYLAVHLRQTHSRESLIELLWPESGVEAGRNSLSVALSSLRHQFEPPGTPANAVIRADRFSVSLNPAAVTTDVFEFEQAIRESARGQSSEREREEHLTRAVERYQGKLLPHLYEEWISGEQERLASLFFDAIARLIQALEAGGRADSALTYARRAISQEPLREEAQYTLIRLLDAVGQPGMALRQFQEYERLLREETAEEPGPALRALARQIERRTGLAAAASPASSVPPSSLRQPVVPNTGPSTVTFLLTDIEGGMRRLEKSGDAYNQALADHHRLLREAFADHGGQEIYDAGKRFLVAFAGALPALRCAIAAQQVLAAHPWPEAAEPVRVRVALHTGDVERSRVTGEYQGLALHRASRLLSAAHGGQTLLSEETTALVRRDLPPEVRLVDLGVFRLRDLPAPERLFQAEHPGMVQAAFPPPRAEAGYASGIPLTFTRFFGREQELARLRELLNGLPAGPRLVTVTGSGGTGKTRLSIEAARRVTDAFHGAVWFVPLADISDASLIVGAILDALRVPRSPQREPLEQVVEALSKQPALLVLDNFEHLVENAGPDIVRALLSRVPTLTALITSRQVLGLSGEQEFVLSPLPTPTSNGSENAERLAAYDSVLLFIDRAQQVLPDFQVTNVNAAAVAELVTRLEGIPLAIELAAARALLFTPSQMLAQLDNRFTFLAGRKRDVVERHRTLWAAMDWSYRLLSPELQRFFRRLSVFRGGWTVGAAETVCEEPLALDYLTQLAECSLVLPKETEQSGMRFRMLETLREYGQERLSSEESHVLQRRHGEYFLSWVEDRYDGLTSRKPVEVRQATDECAAEHDNFRAALMWAQGLRDAGATGLRLVKPLRFYWNVRFCYDEGRHWLRTFLRLSADAPPTEERRMIVNFAGLLASMQSDYEEAISWHEENIRYYRDGGKTDAAFISSLTFLSNCHRSLGDLTRAGEMSEESLAIARSLGLPSYIGSSAQNLALVYLAGRRLEEAKDLLEESIGLFREHGYLHFLSRSLRVRGDVARVEGDCDLAQRCYAEALGILVPSRSERDISWLLDSYATLAQAQGQHERAARLLGATQAAYEAIGIAYVPGGLTGDCVVVAPEHQAAWEQGHHMTWEEAVAYALPEVADEVPETGTKAKDT